MRLHPLLCLPILFLGSCGSTGPQKLEIEPLDSLESIELAYNGAVSLEGLPPHQWTTEDALGGETLRLQCKIYEVDPVNAAQVFDPAKMHLRADRVDREGAERLFEEFGAQEAQGLAFSPTLSIHRGGSGHIAVTNEFAYIESFDLETFGHTTIGDPQIGVGRDGLLIRIQTAEGEDGSPCAFDFCLDLAHLQRPIQEVTSTLPGFHTKMTIQTPVFATQRIELATVLGDDEALIVGPVPAFQGDRTLLLMITARPDDMPGAGESEAMIEALLNAETSDREGVK